MAPYLFYDLSRWWKSLVYTTGGSVPVTGLYQFIGYAEAPQTHLPSRSERRIRLEAGVLFPMVLSSERAACWMLTLAEVRD